MTSAIETQQPTISNFDPLTCPCNPLLQFLLENILTAFQWEAILVRVLLDLNDTARNVLPCPGKETFPQLKQPEEVIPPTCWERIDVNDAANSTTVERAGKKKSNKKRSGELAGERKRKEQAEEAARREAEEKERARKWEECWERKFQAEEERHQAECCAGRDLCVKPRTQSNIWINVTRDRSIQEIRMSFKHVPVPRPKPPPLPPVKIQKPTCSDNVPVGTGAMHKVDKESGTGKKRRRSVRM